MTTLALTPTQLAIVGYLTLQRGRWVTGDDIQRAIFRTHRHRANVTVQILRARRSGALIEGRQIGRRTYGYRLAPEFFEVDHNHGEAR